MKRLPWMLLVGLLACSCGIALAQQVADSTFVGPVRHVYSHVISDEEPEPDYISTGHGGAILFWLRGRGSNAGAAPGWRCRALGPDLKPLFTADLPLEPELKLILSEEEPGGQAVWLLFQHPERSQQLLCLRLNYATAETETYRFRLPVSLQADQFRVATDGLYVRGAYGYNTVVIYLDLDQRQARILPYGPDQRRNLIGSGVEAATGRFYAFSTRRGRGGGQAYLQVYERGQALGPPRSFSLGGELAPTLIYSMGERAGERELALYAPTGMDKAQGLAVLQGLTPRSYTRFADSAGYFAFAGAKAAVRLHQRYAASVQRPAGRFIYNTYLWHPPVALPTGGCLLTGERFVLHSRPYSPIQPNLYNGFDPAAPRPDVKEYETTFLLQLWLDSTLTIRRLETIATPPLIHYTADAQVVSVPWLPPLTVLRSALMYYGSQTGTSQPDWHPVAPERMALPKGPVYEVSDAIQEGDAVYTWGTGNPRSGEARFWWMVR